MSDTKGFTTKMNGDGGSHIDGLTRWSDYELDVLALNNLMDKIRQSAAAEGDAQEFKLLRQGHFVEYLEVSTNKHRANTIVQMMNCGLGLEGERTANAGFCY